MEINISITSSPKICESIYELVEAGVELLKTPEGRKSITNYIKDSFSISRTYFTRLINGVKKSIRLMEYI